MSLAFCDGGGVGELFADVSILLSSTRYTVRRLPAPPKQAVTSGGTS